MVFVVCRFCSGRAPFPSGFPPKGEPEEISCPFCSFGYFKISPGISFIHRPWRQVSLRCTCEPNSTGLLFLHLDPQNRSTFFIMSNCSFCFFPLCFLFPTWLISFLRFKKGDAVCTSQSLTAFSKFQFVSGLKPPSYPPAGGKIRRHFRDFTRLSCLSCPLSAIRLILPHPGKSPPLWGGQEGLPHHHFKFPVFLSFPPPRGGSEWGFNWSPGVSSVSRRMKTPRKD